MAVNYSTNPLEWYATDGISVAEQNIPSGPTLQGTNKVQLVGVFPWGEPDKVYEFSDTQNFVDALIGQTTDPEEYSGVRAMIGKTFGTIQIVRVDATGAAASSRTIDADGYTATAKYKTKAGDQIQIQHTDNGADFDVTVVWGGYSKTYEGRTLGDVADIVDPYVDFATVGAANVIAASDPAPVALSGGSNGVPVDADYIGGVADISGLRLFEAKEDGAIVVLDEYTSAAAITALRNHADLKRGFAFVQGSTGDFAANVAVADGINDDRLGVCLHQVTQLVNGVEKTVDLAPFAASVLSQMPPHYSLADEEFCRQLLKNIIAAVGVTLTRASWISADGAGGIMLEALDGGGFKFHANLTTSTTAGQELISTRRVKDIAIATVVRAVAPIQNKPGMPFYERIGLAQGKRAIEVLIGDPESNPFGAIIEDGGLTLVDGAVQNSKVFHLALSLWGEIRYLIILTTAAIGLDIEEVLQAA